MTINLQIDNLAEKCPLYARYPQQYNTQPAYVEINPTARTISADYSGEIGNAVPMSVWHGRIIRISVPAEIHGPSLAEYLQLPETVAQLEQICDGYDERWDGSNHIGRLTEDAHAVAEQLERDIAEDVMVCEVAEVGDWLFSSNRLDAIWEPHMTIEQAVAECEASAEENWFIDGDIEEALIDQARICVEYERWNELHANHLAELNERELISEEDVQAWREAQFTNLGTGEFEDIIAKEV